MATWVNGTIHGVNEAGEVLILIEPDRASAHLKNEPVVAEVGMPVKIDIDWEPRYVLHKLS